MVLLSQNRIGEAVELAVEQKKCTQLVSILSTLTPSDVVDHCHPLCVLCVAQQLAADFAHLPSDQDPIESQSTRIDWLKELIMACDMEDNNQSNINPENLIQWRSCILTDVIESIKAIELSLNKKGKLTGAVRTDFKMLKAFVSNIIM
mmetsp:Transcript_38794/g.39483  ORF Transcript_38794/g.39483 Transcript_38794/m.39483 type:complete len:148 (+) Transcript_38794:202-645(+)